jgi:redox-sensitive bicupin YhaK (pirin superfamily)
VKAQKRGRLCLIISPDGKEGSLSVFQDVKVYAGLFNGTETAELEIGSNRYAYVHVARGNLDINGTRLDEGDGVRIREEQVLRFTGGNNAEVLVFNLRPNELPN